MTRRRIIAGVIFAAALIVALPVVPRLWRYIGYRSVYSPEGMVLLLERWEGLPGKSSIFPDQKCGQCIVGDHSECLGNKVAEGTLLITLPQTGGFHVYTIARGQGEHSLRIETAPGMASNVGRILVSPNPDFRCTCTDPAHDGDSE